MGKTEVSLTLTNKFDVPGEANAETDAKTLLLKYVLLQTWFCLFQIKAYISSFKSLKSFSFQHQEAHCGCDQIPTRRNAIRNPGHCSNPGAGKHQKGNV